MTTKGLLREHQGAIDRHLEDAAARGDEPGLDPRKCLLELSHQTGGSGLVVSGDAVLDRHPHRSISSLQDTARHERRIVSGRPIPRHQTSALPLPSPPRKQRASGRAALGKLPTPGRFADVLVPFTLPCAGVPCGPGCSGAGSCTLARRTGAPTAPAHDRADVRPGYRALAGVAAARAPTPGPGAVRERLGVRQPALPAPARPGRGHRGEQPGHRREGRHRLPHVSVRRSRPPGRSAPTRQLRAPRRAASGWRGCRPAASTPSRASWWRRIRCWPRGSPTGRSGIPTAGSGATDSTLPGWTRSRTRSGSTPLNSPPKPWHSDSPRSSTTTCASPMSRRRAAPPRSLARRSPGRTTRQAVARRPRHPASSAHARSACPFTIDVFGLTTSATGDMGIGQVWEDLVSTADAVLPMVYPSHYNRGEYGFAHPNSRAVRDHPAGTARRQARSQKLGHAHRGDPALPAGVHAGGSAVRPGARAGADSRRRGPGCHLMGAMEPPKRLRARTTHPRQPSDPAGNRDRRGTVRKLLLPRQVPSSGDFPESVLFRGSHGRHGA